MTQTLNKTPWTPEQVDALDPVVRQAVRSFLAWAEAYTLRTGNLPHFGECEAYVEGYDADHPEHVSKDLAAEIVTREVTAAEVLVVWIRDNGLGAWSELREEHGLTPGDMFQSVVASWLHDIIGCPSSVWA